MIVALLAVAWVAFGATIGFYEARRGHWKWLSVLGALAGPFALPMARQAERDETRSPAIVLDSGRARREHTVSLLAGIDGSPASIAAARQAAEIVGFRLGHLTLASVVDFEAEGPATALAPEVPADAEARAQLHAAADELGSWLGFEPRTVLLTGNPAEALGRHARDREFDMLIVSTRGRGLSKKLLGSCASQLARTSTVPVLMVPTPPPSDESAPRASSSDESAART